MKAKHFFVPLLDVGEVLPFTIKKKKNLEADLAEQDRARIELVKFVAVLEKKLSFGVVYMGMDVIGEKSYERFLLESGGFLEFMVEAPVAINAHFIKGVDAKKFLKGLQAALLVTLPKGPVASMFVESLSVQNQEDSSLTVASWHRIKGVRK